MASYRYFLNNIPVSPLNNGDYILTYNKRESFGLVFDVILEGELKFSYNNSGFDFKSYESDNKCEELDFRIERKCSNVWAIIWEGVFSVIEGKFNDDDCLFTVKPRKKEYILSDIQVNFLDDTIKVNEGGVLGVTASRPGGYAVFPNCRYFDNFLLFVSKKANPKINSIISNFFQINPDGSFYIPGVTNYWDKMAVASLSDIQYPVPSNPARRDFISFEELMNDLYTLFQVQWFIDTNYNLRIEHELYFEGDSGLNLTENKYKKFLLASSKYSYNLDDYPKKEIWKIADHSRSCELSYGGLSVIKKVKNEVSFTTSKIRTDYQVLVHGLSGGGGTANTDDGVFLFAIVLGGSGEWRMNEGFNQNFKLTPDYLVENLHTYYRPDLYALFKSITKVENGTGDEVKSGGIILNSLKPTKLQEIVSVPLCCNESFDPKDKIKTDLGIGYVEKAALNLKTEMLDLQLKYKIDNCTGFLPSDLPDLDLWLQWNDVVIDTPGGPPPYLTTVTRWNDSSGNNRHADQSNNQFKPYYITPVTGGSPVIFWVAYNFPPPDPTANLTHLLTPAFQLFPNKRGTILILFNEGEVSYPLSFDKCPILSTQDGAASNYFDISTNNTSGIDFYSFKEGLNLPSNGVQNGLYVFRRGSDVSCDGSQNNIEAENNPVIIANDQPDSLPLRIGHNDNISSAFVETGNTVIAEIMVYGRYLSDDEIEKIKLYLVKKGIYKLYNY